MMARSKALWLQEHVIFAASFNFGKMLLLDTTTGNVLAVLSDRRRTMRAVPDAAPGPHSIRDPVSHHEAWPDQIQILHEEQTSSC